MGRFALIVMAALVAAALGDTLVEFSADAGLFGNGYYDGDQSGVLPALLCAAAIGLAIVVGTIVTLIRGTAPGAARALVRATAAGLSRRSLLRDLPAIGALQIAGVYGIERTEAALHGAAFAPGPAWLGAPLPIALAMHALVCILCIVVLSALLRVLVRAGAAIVLRFLAAVFDAGSPSPACLSRRARPRVCSAAIAAGHQRGNRAPPRSAAFA